MCNSGQKILKISQVGALFADPDKIAASPMGGFLALITEHIHCVNPFERETAGMQLICFVA